jgi:hypothetical protein
MQRSLQKQPQIKILHALSVNARLRLREADIEEVVNIESLLDSDDSIIGACAFIPLAGVRTNISVDEKINEHK